MPPFSSKKKDIVCARNTLLKVSWMVATFLVWLSLACTTSLMASSIFGNIHNGKLKHRKIDFLFNSQISEYQAIVFCTSFVIEISALYNAKRKNELEQKEEEKKCRNNCRCC